MPIQVEISQNIEARFRVADWHVEPNLNRVTRDEVTVQLALNAMDLLLCLAARPVW